jgi:hypothetical protein
MPWTTPLSSRNNRLRHPRSDLRWRISSLSISPQTVRLGTVQRTGTQAGRRKANKDGEGSLGEFWFGASVVKITENGERRTIFPSPRPHSHQTHTGSTRWPIVRPQSDRAGSVYSRFFLQQIR